MSHHTPSELEILRTLQKVVKEYGDYELKSGLAAKQFLPWIEDYKLPQEAPVEENKELTDIPFTTTPKIDGSKEFKAILQEKKENCVCRSESQDVGDDRYLDDCTCSKEKWVPKDGDKFYFISGRLEIHSSNFYNASSSDACLKRICNYFETYDQALAARDAVAALLKSLH